MNTNLDMLTIFYVLYYVYPIKTYVQKTTLQINKFAISEPELS